MSKQKPKPEASVPAVAPRKVKQPPFIPFEAESMDGGGLSLKTFATPDAPYKLNEDLGGVSDNLLAYLVNKITDAVGAPASDESGKTDMSRVNALVEIALALKPRDALEAAYAAHIAVMQHLALDCAGKARRADFLTQHQVHMSNAGKLSRTFVQLVEGLDRHRGQGPTQTVRVENVHMNGPTAIGILGGGGATLEPGRQPHGTDPEDQDLGGHGAALPGQDAGGRALPEPGDAREQALPVARGQRRRAEG